MKKFFIEMPSTLCPSKWRTAASIAALIAWWWCVVVVVANPAFAAESPADAIAILPAAVTLDHAQDRQQLLTVTAKQQTGDDRVFGESVAVRYDVADGKIAKIVDGVVTPIAEGKTMVTATDDQGRTATVPVHVRGIEDEHRWSFRNDVQSVLAKLGCNMGACHGALAGKGGFGLSLRGYDVEADFAAITRQARGRRIELSDPGRSLLLAKPTGALPHKGGLRLSVDDRDYEVLSGWIASGADAPSEDDARLTSISVHPAEALMSPGQTSRVLVSAHYDDGRTVDVTHWSKFSATDQAVANVDEDGRVEVASPGQGSVLVWFGSKVALANFTVPFAHEVPAEAYASAPRRNFIDDLNLDQLQTLHLRPSPPCDDDEFLRRATVDTIGRLPTLAERERYQATGSATRRDELIEHLLASTDYVDYWTYKWSDVLLINGTRLRPMAVKSYYEWLHEEIRRGTPWDELTSQILTSTGDSFEHGATNFFALNQSPEDMTENACQAFMGLSIGCAKCHNHPLEKWTNDQYYAMANLFSRVRAKGWGGDGRNGDGRRQLYVSTTGELVQPNRGKPQPPAPLDADPMSFDDPRDRREVLADWMTSPNNPYFSRAITNRVWASFFGRGLVEEVDDLRLSNPASNPALLDAAAEHLVDQDFDLRALMRTILQSETYGRSSLPLDDNREESKFYSRYYPRRMMAEVLLDAIDQVIGTATSFTDVAFPGADKQATNFYDPGTRAIELYDSAVDSYFLKVFGRNPREITCECERDEEPSMVQVLHLSNGETLNPKLQNPNGLPARAVAEAWSDNQVIDTLFLAALSRRPTAAERERLLDVLQQYSPEERATAIADLAWSVLTSIEFTFNH